MPRRYTLGKRASPKSETRGRIVTAAAAIYLDRGSAAASNLAIARAADVAPATVRNHFPDRRDLTDAVFSELLSGIRPPAPAIFDGIEGIRERITRLASELAAFYERGESSWQLYQREPDLIEAWAGGVDRYYRDVDELMRSALGPLSPDDTALAVVAAVIGPPAFFALRARNLSSEQAVELCIALVVPWLEARSAAKTST